MSTEQNVAIEIIKADRKIFANNADISQSHFKCVKGERLTFECVNLTGTKIVNADLSDLEIDGAQLGGAHIHDIGLPPEGHPGFKPKQRQRPIKFNDCTLHDSSFNNCDLSNVEITDCNISGMKINGILIEDLLKAFEE